jgi:hypothetical protein
MNAHALLKPESTRACRNCRHALPHDSTEYEDTHSRCSHRRQVKHGCEDHRRYSARCADDTVGGCWIEVVACDCSEEERVIADLVHQRDVLRVAAAGVVRHLSVTTIIDGPAAPLWRAATGLTKALAAIEQEVD